MLKSSDRVSTAGFGNGQASPSAMASSRQPRAGAVKTGAASGRAPPVEPAEVVGADWEALFSAVKARLRLSASSVPAALDARARDSAGPLRATVLECVTALDQLHGALVHELSLRQQLELEIFDAHTALAQARAELAGTQAGEKRARHLALHDSLTSLPNRSHFRQRLDDELALVEPMRQPLALLYLDLDGFKPINDKHGHDAGDELLRIIAARLSRAVRSGDMVGRLGGDEFACLLADLPGREQLCNLACKVFDAVSAPVKIGKLKLTVRPSIGIAICPTDGHTADALLKSADAAMYSAKRDRTGYAFFARSGGA